jgi:maltose alpha-D-glucosyltransferase/alpha-amylase
MGRDGTEGVLHDAVGSRAFARALLDVMAQERRLPGIDGELRAVATGALTELGGPEPLALEPVVGNAEQSNTAVVFGDKFILKIFRRLEPGLNPDIEISCFLTKKGFPHVPPLAGALEYRRPAGDPVSLGIMTGYVPTARDAWEYALDTLTRYFERVRSLPESAPLSPVVEASLLELSHQDIPPDIAGTLGTFLESARLLGTRTGELHLTLASDSEHADFAPEPFTPFYQRSLYQSARNLLVQVLHSLQRRLDVVPESVRPSSGDGVEVGGGDLKAAARGA